MSELGRKFEVRLRMCDFSVLLPRLAGIETMCREARLSQDPRVRLLALRVLARQQREIEGLI